MRSPAFIAQRVARLLPALAVAFVLAATGRADASEAAAPSRQLSFRADSTFTIVQFTDMHLSAFEPGRTEMRTLDLVGRIIDAEKPDLIVLTGDICRMVAAPDSIRSWRLLADLLDDKGVPWAFVHGNHDSELSGYARIDSFLATTRHCLYEPGQPGVSTHGTYVLPIYRHRGQEIGALVWCLDSGTGRGNPRVREAQAEEQVAWFRAEADRLMAGDDGTITGLALFHIPLREYQTAWDTQRCIGHKLEGISPQRAGGLYAALQEHGRVVATFCGHMHGNDYEGTLDGVSLCFGRVTGFGAGRAKSLQRGGRVIKLKEGVRRYTSTIRQTDGTIADQPVHEPEPVQQPEPTSAEPAPAGP